jgi:hypothetical protein
MWAIRQVYFFMHEEYNRILEIIGPYLHLSAIFTGLDSSSFEEEATPKKNIIGFWKLLGHICISILYNYSIIQSAFCIESKRKRLQKKKKN